MSDERMPVIAALHRKPWSALADVQSGIVSRQQLVGLGLTPTEAKANLITGRWRRMLPGVYATFTGPVDAIGRSWAAVLYAGSGAAVAGRAALWLWSLVNEPPDLLTIAVPETRRVRGQPGVRVERRRGLNIAAAPSLRHPSAVPPRLRLEEALLDVTSVSTESASARSPATRDSASPDDGPASPPQHRAAEPTAVAGRTDRGPDRCRRRHRLTVGDALLPRRGAPSSTAGRSAQPPGGPGRRTSQIPGRPVPRLAGHRRTRRARGSSERPGLPRSAAGQRLHSRRGHDAPVWLARRRRRSVCRSGSGCRGADARRLDRPAARMFRSMRRRAGLVRRLW